MDAKRVHSVLTGPKYYRRQHIQPRVIQAQHKTSKKSKSHMWMRCDDAFEAIVPPAQFAKAQELIQARARRLTDEKLLTSLRGLWAKQGRLTTDLIDSRSIDALYCFDYASVFDP